MIEARVDPLLDERDPGRTRILSPCSWSTTSKKLSGAARVGNERRFGRSGWGPER